MKPASLQVLAALLAALLMPSALFAQSAEELIAKGDVHYDKLQTAKALEYYLPAEKLDPKNVRLLVRISREYRHLMSDARSTPEKLRLGQIALDYATRAASLAPNDPDANLAVAISYGKLLAYQGNRERIQAQPKIKAAAEKVIRLDPNNDLAWHILGRWYLVIAEVRGVKRAVASMIYGKLPPATFEQAAECFERAIKLKPERLMHYIELGRTYAAMGRTEDAKRMIRKGLSMRETEKDDPETKARGREILQKLR